MFIVLLVIFVHHQTFISTSCYVTKERLHKVKDPIPCIKKFGCECISVINLRHPLEIEVEKASGDTSIALDTDECQDSIGTCQLLSFSHRLLPANR